MAYPRGFLADPTGWDRQGSRPALSCSGMVVNSDDSMARVGISLPWDF
jgi:hypothetical protein